MSQPTNRSPIVRAIDVGYGNTKFVTSHVGTNTEIVCQMFPSLAPKASVTDLAGEFLKKRNTVRVKVSGYPFEVGPDVVKAQNGHESGRVLKEDYCLSDTYRALVYGALVYMGVSQLDVLALGLPVSTWKDYRHKLAAEMQGDHQINDEKTIPLRKCVVVPQPLGGFYDFATRNGLFAQMKSETNLIIDPGYYTLDWLLADGITPIDARSNAVNNGGMAEILRDVAEAVAADVGCSVTEIGSVERIDASLRERKPIRVFGKEVNRPITEYIEIAKKRALDPLNKLVTNVGAAGDIDNIIVVGGGSHIYADLIRKEFPRHNIQVSHDAIYSNVRGFQIVGEKMAQAALRAQRAPIAA